MAQGIDFGDAYTPWYYVEKNAYKHIRQPHLFRIGSSTLPYIRGVSNDTYQNKGS